MNHETIWKRRLVLQLSFRMRPEYFSWMDVFPDLTAFIVLSEESRVVQANFASTLNASTIASTPNRSTITKKTWKLENVKTCPLKLPFFRKTFFTPGSPSCYSLLVQNTLVLNVTPCSNNLLMEPLWCFWKKIVKSCSQYSGSLYRIIY